MTMRQLSLFLAATLLGSTVASGNDAVNESSRLLPVAYQVDVVVVGGSTGAVAAAVEAARSGAKVFLAAERPYLGDDMTATLRLWRQADDELDSELAQEIFNDHEAKPAGSAGQDGTSPSGKQPPRPIHVKKTLDKALLAAGVPFLYSCYPTDVLRDSQGQPCGIVMANRAGRQAVVAKTIIDATQRAVVARMAGAKFRPFEPGPLTIKHVVIGCKVRSGENLTSRIAAAPFRGPFPNPAKTSSGVFQVIEYTLQVPMAGDTDAAWAEAEQRVRSETYDPEQQFTADLLVHIPSDPMHGRQTATGPWSGSQKLPLDALRPAEVAGLYVLGTCADVSRASAERLLQPGVLMALGRRVGKAAADDAAKRAVPEGVRLPGTPTPQPTAEGEVRESLTGVRPVSKGPTVPQDARALPVLGRYDVVVVGGGTSGAPAAIASARRGAKTLVIEHQHGLGGLGTLGTVAGYFFGYRSGFTQTVGGGDKWVIEQKMQWWRDEVLKAGGQVWFGCIGCGALVDKDRVSGVVVATPRGRGLVLAKAVVDTTGNADIAAAAGAKCLYTDHRDFAVLGGGLGPRELGATEGNVDFSIADETDMVDVWHMFVYAKDKFPAAFDLASIIDARERRRIVGDHTLSLLDELNQRTYPDTIAVAYSIFDYGPVSNYPVDPIFLTGGFPKPTRVKIPYRCCLPKGLDRILVAALGLGAEHTALPMIRMQPDLQNLGYAVGVAAAMTALADKPTRQIDLRALQQHLAEIGNVPAQVLEEKDSYPLPAGVVAEAVRNLQADFFRHAAVILTQRDEAKPLLHAAYHQSEGPTKLTYARMLGILGDPLGIDTLLGAVAGYSRWDKGWPYMRWQRVDGKLRQIEPRPLTSDLDRLLIILGRLGDRRAVPVILKKVPLLTADDDFSHHRAVALALELLGDPAAAKPLAELLAKPGMSGHVHDSIDVARQLENRPNDDATQYHRTASRRESLRELMLARALYRCGDYEGVGEKTLRAYANDLRGHLARHAQGVLETYSRDARLRRGGAEASK